MKKSNKQILITFVLPMLFIGVVHLSLYARYRAGEFVTREQLHSEQFVRKEFPAPVYLSIKGVRNIQVIPSDTFAVEYRKEYVSSGARSFKKEFGADGSVKTVNVDEPVLHYFQQGDTLTVVGYDSAAWKNSTIEDKEDHSFQEITLYCRGIPTMAFEGAAVSIDQQKRSAMAPESHIVLKNSQWIFGNLDGEELKEPPYLYETIRVQAENSKLDLNVNAAISSLELNLDSLSSVDDHGASIGHLDIHWSDRSQIRLSGANLRKLQVSKP